ncbi:murein biosynthesis integral membrane protein MurJ [Ornithinimicrobium pekingense]|uniref:Lipid II flippase MurJ n=1 Tax=Ornithinimicrobium pekingense TaxID=384677 RepID=A0ABQ2FDU2_9MICO|nr:lipid II flippase MurJ [Ornithinimicrobium pekingense]GGK77818.1 putative lipid II flippase MurJ [Ornithinimicrobium pekingense]
MAARSGVGRAALLVSALTALSTVLGLVRDAVIAAVYGAGAQLDAWFVALGLSSILLGVLGTSLNRAVTPQVAREADAESTGEGMPCAGHPGWWTATVVGTVALGVVGVLLGVAAGPVSAVLAPGLAATDDGTLVLLVRVVLLATVLIAATDLLAGLAQGHGVFRWAALQGVPFNVVMIAAAALLGPRLGVVALAWGFVVGSLLRMLLQLWPAWRHRWRLRARWDLGGPAWREVRAMVPALMVGQAVVNVNTLVDRAVASTVEEGAVTAIFLGWRLVNLPQVLVVAALMAPLYPAMGSAAARGARELRGLVHRGTGVTLTVLVPVVALLAAVPHEVVSLAFGRGGFDDEAVAATATAVLWFLPALLAVGWRQVVVSASYAVGDTRGPVAVSILAMVVNVVGDLTLAPVMGVPGIVLATSVSLVLAAVLTSLLVARRHRLLAGRVARGQLSRATVGGAAAGLAGWLASRLLGDLHDLVVVAAVGAVVLAVQQGVLHLLRAPERHVARDVLARLR